MAKKKPNDYGNGISETLARVPLPKIQKFFESEEGQESFNPGRSGKRKNDD